MSHTVTGPDLRPLSRFTFAGRGCRDPRREPRSLPQSLRPHPPCSSTGTPSPVATLLLEAGRPSAGRPSPAGATGATGDHPPPGALRYGPGPWQLPMSLWWSSGAATPS